MAYILQMMVGCRFMVDVWWDDHGMWTKCITYRQGCTGWDFFHGIADGIKRDKSGCIIQTYHDTYHITIHSYMMC